MNNIKSYAYGTKLQLTKNINVNELKCKCSVHHTIKVDLVQVDNIQDFMNKNGYDKVIFSCWYRCSAHDKKVGGSGTGQHTKGTAADCCFYKGGKIVPAKEVCCKAQDYGFKGIGYIDANYTHLDNRATGLYRGDERKGRSNNIPNNDFYAYFNISKTSGNTPSTPVDPAPVESAYKTFVKGVQSACGAKVDGIAGPETLSKTVTLSTSKNTKHKVVKVVQTYLISLGYSVGKCGADGIYGKDTKAAVKSYQKKNSCTTDGIITAKNKTWKKLLKLA